MKTYHLIKSNGGKTRLFLLTVFLLLTGTMSVQAYDVWVGGVQLTSGVNATGGGIQSGTVLYNASTKTLTLTDVTIYVNNTNSKKKHAIYNGDVKGLTVYFKGTNVIEAVKGATVMCNEDTDIEVASGRTDIFGNVGCIYINGYNCSILTRNNCKLFITGDNCAAIEGNNTGGTSGNVSIAGKNIELEGSKGNLVNLNKVSFYSNSIYGCDVTLVSTDNSSYPSVNNVINMPDNNYSTASSNTPVIVSPSKAEFNSSKKSICYSNGNRIYNDNIVINNDFVYPVSNKIFPDANFRSYLVDRFGVVIKQTQIDNCTDINVRGKSIGSLMGIGIFTELETLNCVDNDLTVLDLDFNTKLIGVECDYNQLTVLYVPNTLQWLGCSYNYLTSFLRGYTFNKLKDLNCSYNSAITYLGTDFSNLSALENFDCSGTNFSTLDVSSCKKLKELTCEDMRSLTRLDCKNTALKQLSVSECPNLKTLDCHSNNLSYLNVYGCFSLQLLNCYDNMLTTIYNMSSCKSSLQTFNCNSNKFSSLNLLGYSQLQNLYCHNNQLTSLTGLSGNTALLEVYCDRNQLTSLDVTGCSNLYELRCYSNKFNYLELSDLPNLQKLDCSNNPSLTTLEVSDLHNLLEVDCSACDLRRLDWYDLKLTMLDCSYNRNLTILNNSRDYTNPIRPLTSLNVTGCSSLNTLNLRDNDELTTLDLTDCSSLAYLDCTYNKLTTLDLTPCPNLISVSCQHNNLTSIDLSNSSNIEYVYCGNNNSLSLLNVKDFSHLVELGCSKCQLQQLDLRGCSALSYVACDNNQITSLMLPQESTALSQVYCYNNRLEDVMMGLVVSSLPNRTGATKGKLYALTDDAYNEHNTFTSQNANEARSRNWDVYAQTNGIWDLYAGSSTPTTIRTADADVDANALRYNMSGQRVGRDYKGVVIVNGRKVVK